MYKIWLQKEDGVKIGLIWNPPQDILKLDELLKQGYETAKQFNAKLISVEAINEKEDEKNAICRC